MELIGSKDTSGNPVSPVLPEHVKNYLIDIDGTVGEDIPNEDLEGWLLLKLIQTLLKQSTDGMQKATKFAFSPLAQKITDR